MAMHVNTAMKVFGGLAGFALAVGVAYVLRAQAWTAPWLILAGVAILSLWTLGRGMRALRSN
jgi:hypothetical protein